MASSFMAAFSPPMPPPSTQMCCQRTPRAASRRGPAVRGTASATPWPLLGVAWHPEKMGARPACRAGIGHAPIGAQARHASAWSQPARPTSSPVQLPTNPASPLSLATPDLVQRSMRSSSDVSVRHAQRSGGRPGSRQAARNLHPSSVPFAMSLRRGTKTRRARTVWISKTLSGAPLATWARHASLDREPVREMHAAGKNLVDANPISRADFAKPRARRRFRHAGTTPRRNFPQAGPRFHKWSLTSETCAFQSPGVSISVAPSRGTAGDAQVPVAAVQVAQDALEHGVQPDPAVGCRFRGRFESRSSGERGVQCSWESRVGNVSLTVRRGRPLPTVAPPARTRREHPCTQKLTRMGVWHAPMPCS